MKKSTIASPGTFGIARFATHFLVFGCVGAASLQSYADGICTDNGAQCSTVGGSATATAAAGIYSMVQYSQANRFEELHTKPIVTASSQGTLVSSEVEGVARQIADGDKITVVYTLNNERNRSFHIDKMESQAGQAESQAAVYRSNAVQALARQRTYTDRNGHLIQEGPDFASAALYNGYASSAESEAIKFRAEALAARRGASVPTYSFDHVVSDLSGNAVKTSAFLREEMASGGTILKVARLPSAQMFELRGMIGHARAGLAIAAVAGALTLEEVVIGKVASSITRYQDRGGYTPPYRERGNSGAH